MFQRDVQPFFCISAPVRFAGRNKERCEMQSSTLTLNGGAGRSIPLDVSGTLRRAWKALGQTTQEAIVMNLLVVALMLMVLCLVEAPVVSAVMAAAAVALTWRLNQFPDTEKMVEDVTDVTGKEVAA